MVKNELAPIILFVYNRPEHTKKTIEALQKNHLAAESDLFIFADGARTHPPAPSLYQIEGGQEKVSLFGKEGDLEGVASVGSYIKTITGFKSITITESPTNKGLANSVIAGVTEIIEKYGAVIVLEDDLITSPYFLTYMNDALKLFENRNDIFSISGYTYPENVMKIPETYREDAYLSLRFGSWGWGTWKNRWKQVDWELKDFNKFRKNRAMKKEFGRGGEDRSYMLISQIRGAIDSWAIRFDYAHFKNRCYNLRPTKTLVKNIGFDGSGIHCDVGEGFDDVISDRKVALNRDVSPNEILLQLFFDVNRRPWYKKVLDRMPWVRKLTPSIPLSLRKNRGGGKKV